MDFVDGAVGSSWRGFSACSGPESRFAVRALQDSFNRLNRLMIQIRFILWLTGEH
jgi:hypothetical protein